MEVNQTVVNTGNSQYLLNRIMSESLINRGVIIKTFLIDMKMLETMEDESEIADIINSYDYYLEKLKERGTSFCLYNKSRLFPSFNLSKKIIELVIQSNGTNSCPFDLDEMLFDIGSNLISVSEWVEYYPIRSGGSSIDNTYFTYILLNVYKAKPLMSDREIDMFGHFVNDIKDLVVNGNN